MESCLLRKSNFREIKFTGNRVSREFKFLGNRVSRELEFLEKSILSNFHLRILYHMIKSLLGAQIYGRVQVDPVQSLGSGFSVHIEKVFLCSGRDGYIPKYQPANSEYGCLADAPNLLYRFKVIVSTPSQKYHFSGN